MDRFPDGLLERCTFAPAGTPVECAVSGGADSLALMLLAVGAGCVVTAVHVDHGLRPGSADEADVVRRAAAQVGAEFRAERVQVGAGPNLEARARQARREVLGPDVCTGHTMDDQAETVVINLLRGAGVHGLAAMRRGPTHPLLAVRRSETVALCAARRLDPVRDPSNDDRRFVRNRVRHEVLPLLSTVAGRDVVPVLAGQADVLAGDAELLDAMASHLDGADVDALRAASPALARRAVRQWLTGDDGYPPERAAVERVLAVANGALRATDVAPGRRVRRSGRRLEQHVVGDSALR